MPDRHADRLRCRPAVLTKGCQKDEEEEGQAGVGRRAGPGSTTAAGSSSGTAKAPGQRGLQALIVSASLSCAVNHGG